MTTGLQALRKIIARLPLAEGKQAKDAHAKVKSVFLSDSPVTNKLFMLGDKKISNRFLDDPDYKHVVDRFLENQGMPMPSTKSVKRSFAENYQPVLDMFDEWYRKKGRGQV